MMRTDKFDFGGYEATVIVPERPNGKWVWKTEFLYAFDKAEQALVGEGYTRVYYRISNMYGAPSAVELMDKFYTFVTEKYTLDEKCFLFGFSRGGLYAMSFAERFPERVEGVYLDAPVVDLVSWPPVGSREESEMLAIYGEDRERLRTSRKNPKNRIEDFLKGGYRILIVSGDSDKTVPFEENSYLIADLAKKKNRAITLIVKPGCDHHPHSLDDVRPIINFVKGENMKNEYTAPEIDKVEIDNVDVITQSPPTGTLPMQPLDGYEEGSVTDLPQ